ncbi:MAG: DUF177 domain-containing protein [candidate division WOR-3 bacterium]
MDTVSNFKEIHATVHLIKKSMGIDANFTVHFLAELTCSRCLSQFYREFNERYHLEYIEGKDPLLVQSRVDLKSGDIDRVYYTGRTIDLSIGIREPIILAIPVAPLCKSDCRGLCPVCGIDLNKKKCSCVVFKPDLFRPK